MKHKNTVFCLGLPLACVLIFSFSAIGFPARDQSSKVYNNYLKSAGNSASIFNSRIEKADKIYLKKYFREENKLFRKLCKKNPAAADRLFSYSSNPLVGRSIHTKAVRWRATTG